MALSEGDSTKHRKTPPVIVVPALGYSPETRAFVGAVGLSAFRLGDRIDTRTSNAKAEFQYTQNKQVSFEIANSTFTAHDRYFFNLLGAYRKFPETWWGIGNSTPKGNRESYKAKRLELDLTALRRLRGSWYLGGIYTLRSMYDVQPFPAGILDSKPIVGKYGGVSSGWGLELLHDNRDNLLNPQQGCYLEIRAQMYHRLWGSDFQFGKLGFDLRKYIRLRKRHILAVQAKIGLENGNPPFRMLNLFGGTADMRGYYQGRYRERDYYAIQAEYRAPLFWRFGWAAFAGFGDVGYNFSDIGSSIFKYSVGGGLRVLVDRAENINIRFDYAWGYQTHAFYVGFGEAF